MGAAQAGGAAEGGAQPGMGGREPVVLFSSRVAEAAGEELEPGEEVVVEASEALGAVASEVTRSLVGWGGAGRAGLPSKGLEVTSSEDGPPGA